MSMRFYECLVDWRHCCWRKKLDTRGRVLTRKNCVDLHLFLKVEEGLLGHHWNLDQTSLPVVTSASERISVIGSEFDMCL